MSKLLGKTLMDANDRTYKVLSKDSIGLSQTFTIEYVDTKEKEVHKYAKVWKDSTRMRQNIKKHEAGEKITCQSKYLGQILKNERGYEFEVLTAYRYYPSPIIMFTVRFLETGYETETQLCALSKRRVTDWSRQLIGGVAKRGAINPKDYPFENNIWNHMIYKCYSEKSHQYKNFGALGYTVGEDWLVFENFVNTISQVEGYDEELYKSKKVVLKVKEGEKVYSLVTTYFEEMNFDYHSNIHRHRMRKVAAKDPNGKLYIATGIKKFANEHGLNSAAVFGCLAGRYKEYQGWTFKYLKGE